MIPRIKSVKPMGNYILHVVFDDGKSVAYDVTEEFALACDAAGVSQAGQISRMMREFIGQGAKKTL